MVNYEEEEEDEEGEYQAEEYIEEVHYKDAISDVEHVEHMEDVSEAVYSLDRETIICEVKEGTVTINFVPLQKRSLRTENIRKMGSPPDIYGPPSAHVRCKKAATLLQCFIATVLHCYTATLLQYFTATLLQYFTATLLHCYSTSLLHCYRVWRSSMKLGLYTKNDKRAIEFLPEEWERGIAVLLGIDAPSLALLVYS